VIHSAGQVVLAHGVGEVRGLPLPGELVLQTGGVVVLFSFLAVALLWRAPRYAGPDVARDSVPATPGAGGAAPIPRESPPLPPRVVTFAAASRHVRRREGGVPPGRSPVGTRDSGGRT